MSTTKNVQSVERAFHIIESFLVPGNEKMSLKEISEAIELSKSTTFGLVNTLNNIGYLTQDPIDSRYSLSIKFFQINNNLPLKKLILDLTKPILLDLNAKTEETTHFATRSNNQLVYLEKISQPGSISMNTAVGTENYLHCTGIGKCLLAYAPDEVVQNVANRNLLKLTKNTITSKDKLLEELDKVRAQGYAIDDEEIAIGLKCMAVPVFSDKNVANFALSVSGFVTRIDEWIENDLYSILKETSHRISKEVFNYTPE